jgi:hypothetical protein
MVLLIGGNIHPHGFLILEISIGGLNYLMACILVTYLGYFFISLIEIY